MFCKKCHTENADQAVYCNQCGAPLVVFEDKQDDEPEFAHYESHPWYYEKHWAWFFFVVFMPLGVLLLLQSPRTKAPERIISVVTMLAIIALANWFFPFNTLYNEYMNENRMIQKGTIYCEEEDSLYTQQKWSAEKVRELAPGCYRASFDMDVEVLHRDFKKIKIKMALSNRVFVVSPGTVRRKRMSP